MSQKEKFIPQGGPGSAGESSTAQAVCSEEYGGSNFVTKPRPARISITQTTIEREGENTPTGDMEDEMKQLMFGRGQMIDSPLPRARRGSQREDGTDPFQRRDSIPRTPPKGTPPSRRRTQEEAAEDLEKRVEKDTEPETETTGFESSPEEARTEDGKRKRKEEGTSEDLRLQNEMVYLKETIEKTVRAITELNSLVAASTNTKKEITSKTASLCLYAGRLASRRITGLLEKGATGELGGPKVARREGAAVETKTMGTQTHTGNQPRKYQVTAIREGNPLITAGKQCDVAVWRHPTDTKMERGIQKLFREKYGEIDQTNEAIGQIKVTTWVLGKTQSTPQDRHVFRLDTGKDMTENRKRLEEFRDLLKANNREQVAMAWDDLNQLQEVRDATEDIFQDTKIKVTINIPVVKGKSTVTETPKTVAKTYDTDAIFIKKKADQTYASLLKEVREEVIDKGLETSVPGVRETKTGDLMISLKKKEQAKAQIETALATKLGKDKVRTRKETKDEVVFHVKIDALTTKAEVETAIRRAVGTTKEVSILSLRPGFAGTQSAMIAVNKEEAQQLRKSLFIKIGLPNCRIKERVAVETCYRCWGTGHSARACNGPDLSKACRNCGKLGHEKKVCPNESNCPICEKQGHPANTTRCLAFRKAIRKLEEAREGRQSTPNLPRRRGPTKEPSSTPGASKQKTPETRREEDGTSAPKPIQTKSAPTRVFQTIHKDVRRWTEANTPPQ